MHWRRQRKYSKHFGKSYFLKTETNVKFEFSRGFSAVPVCFKSTNLYFRLSTPSRGRVNFCQKIKSSTFTLFINSIKVNTISLLTYILKVVADVCLNNSFVNCRQGFQTYVFHIFKNISVCFLLRLTLLNLN